MLAILRDALCGDTTNHGTVRRSRRIGRALGGFLLALALLGPGRAAAEDVGALGLLWLPDEVAHPVPVALVLALHDQTGIGARGWHYGEQLLAIGIAVLHLDVFDGASDGAGPRSEAEAAGAARDRLAAVLDQLAQDPRFADAPLGLLAFGEAGRLALHAAAEPARQGRVGGLALLYPGCEALAPAAEAEGASPSVPVLLLHGDSDPANPPGECLALAARLGRAAPVRRVQYAGAGYAWDFAPVAPQEVVRLAWPGRPGRRLAASYWPQAVELAATQVAAFFAARLGASRP